IALFKAGVRKADNPVSTPQVGADVASLPTLQSTQSITHRSKFFRLQFHSWGYIWSTHDYTVIPDQHGSSSSTDLLPIQKGKEACHIHQRRNRTQEASRRCIQDGGSYTHVIEFGGLVVTQFGNVDSASALCIHSLPITIVRLQVIQRLVRGGHSSA